MDDRRPGSDAPVDRCRAVGRTDHSRSRAIESSMLRMCSSRLLRFPPPACMALTSQMRKSGGLDQTDLEGVPTEVDTRIVLSGEEIGGLWTSHCALDLISGQWRIMSPGDPIVGPSLIVQRALRLRPTAELWPLVG